MCVTRSQLSLLQEMWMSSITGFPRGTLNFSVHASTHTIRLHMGKTSGYISWIQLCCFYSWALPGEIANVHEIKEGREDKTRS